MPLYFFPICLRPYLNIPYSSGPPQWTRGVRCVGPEGYDLETISILSLQKEGKREFDITEICFCSALQGSISVKSVLSVRGENYLKFTCDLLSKRIMAFTFMERKQIYRRNLLNHHGAVGKERFLWKDEADGIDGENE